MIVFVSGASVARQRWPSPHLGWLKTPSNYNSVASILAAGCLWAGENDCFHGLHKRAYVTMLKQIADAPDHSRLVYVNVPDVVADARATMVRWRMWLPVLRYYGLPPAFVAQDGQAIDDVPWDDLRALFIGGSTEWKEGPYAAQIMREAKRRGKWVHVGRVNTMRRKNIIDALHADSFDGSCFSKWTDKYLPWMLRTLPYKQHGFEEVLCSS